MSKDADALKLFRAAVPLDIIREKLSFKNNRSVEAAVRRALKKAIGETETVPITDLEIDRIDSLYRGIYPAALRGDTKSAEMCLKLSAQKQRLIDSRGPKTGLSSAFETTVSAIETTDSDATVIATGKALAMQIDDSLEHGTPLERTKALYLVPHLMNVLRELGATPAAREAISGLVVADSKPSELDVWREKQRKVK